MGSRDPTQDGYYVTDEGTSLNVQKTRREGRSNNRNEATISRNNDDDILEVEDMCGVIVSEIVRDDANLQPSIDRIIAE